MASSSGTCSGSSTIPNSGSEEDLQQVLLVDDRKRKRMISNRESARRSRMRKQKHLDDLGAHVTQLRNENHHILTSLNHTTQRYLAIESQNSVLRAQLGELNHRLQSLNEIIQFLDMNAAATNGVFEPPFADTTYLNIPGYLNHPIMASADLLNYLSSSLSRYSHN